jgi:hypothetical protein
MLDNYMHRTDTEDWLEEWVAYIIDTLHKSVDGVMAEEAGVYRLHYRNNLDIEASEEEVVDWLVDYRNILDIPVWVEDKK